MIATEMKSHDRWVESSLISPSTLDESLPEKIAAAPRDVLHHADTHIRSSAPSGACTNRMKSPSA
jgi:hypothetical protein